MKKIVETGITRRAAIAAAAVGGISLLMPKGVLAAEFQTLDQNRIDYFVRPDLTENQFDAMLRERAEEEAAQIIEQALAGYDGDARAGGRPTYDTVYGSVVNKSTGWHDVAGQPAGGVQISGGGITFRRRIGRCVGIPSRRSWQRERFHPEGKSLPQRDGVRGQHFRIGLLQGDGERDPQDSTLRRL